MKNNHPYELLAALNCEEEKIERGKMKIFFGILPGVGKTSAMLRAAQAEVVRGKQVVAGWLNCFDCRDITSQLESITIIPFKKTEHKGVYFEEPDLDAILAMRPQLVLLPDLAHTNYSGSTYVKRYRKIQVLLDNGIDVYTTLNVSQLESCSGFAARITGETEPDTVPDEIFMNADEVELVDLTHEKYVVRISGKKIVTGCLHTGFPAYNTRKEITSSLRKLAHRMVLDRIDFRKQNNGQLWDQKQKMMVLIGADAFSEHLIRRTQASAYLMDTEWIALYVENGRTLSEKRKNQLANNIRLARRLGADVMSYSGNDPVKECLAIAHREKIVHIVIGKARKWSEKWFVHRLLEKSGNINIFVYGAEIIPEHKTIRHRFSTLFASASGQYIFMVLIAVGVALLCIPLAHITGYLFLPFALIILLFIIAVNFRVGAILLSALFAVATWHFLVFSPRYSLQIGNTSHLFLFTIFLVITLLNGILVIRFRQQGARVVTRENQTNALFLLSRKLSNATCVDEVVEAGTRSIKDYFSADAFFIFMDDKHLVERKYIPPDSFAEPDMETAVWAFNNDRMVGRFTDIFSSDKYTYYPLKGTKLNPGVVAVLWGKPRVGSTALFWDALLSQISQAIEHQYMGQLARRTSLLNESDKLYKTLFNSISHELRIPISTIMVASDLLSGELAGPVKTELCEEITDASKRLNRLVENLLNMSRLESGRIAAHSNWCDINDLFRSVTENLEEELRPFSVELSVPEAMPMAMLDFGLMDTVLHNLVYNSSIYASHGTTIGLTVAFSDNNLVFQVTDEGPGFEPGDLLYVFDKFWRYKDSTPGGLGLGLSIVKGFVEAHKGTVAVENRKTGGVCFTMRIPMENVEA